jgi:peptidoglycan/LPS O-acetylase OafA/YrhL
MSRPRPYSDPAEATLSGQARRRESSWPARYDMLDGWRGIAALSVVLDHLGLWSFGFDAVMLFFVISGYCITAAAEAAFRKGMGFRQFMWRRVRRIYPPYLFAILFFYLTRMVRSAAGGAGFHATFTAWVQNLTLTQWLTLLRHPQANPATNPTLFVNTFWSLCYEEQFYLVMGVIFIIPLMLGRRRLILGLFAIGLGWNLASPRLCHGFFLDYWPHFAVGSLLFYRLCRLPNTKIRLLYDAALVAAVVALAMLAWRENLSAATVGRRPFREAFVTCGFALTLIALRLSCGLGSFHTACI